MRRSLAPSQVAKRLLEEPPAIRSDIIYNNTRHKLIKHSTEVLPITRDQKENESLSEDSHVSHEELIRSILSRPFQVPMANYESSGFTRTLGIRRAGVRRPLHDPDDPEALVVYMPATLGAHEQLMANKEQCEVAVVVDPLLARKLRPHQREGVLWMYECVTGSRDPSCCGCILADEMGLGKTLQCVTLAWTLLRQSPSGKPWGGSAVVVAPSVLVANWANEVKKWLGDRLPVLALKPGPGLEKQLAQFASTVVGQAGTMRGRPMVMVLSYEALRMHLNLLKNVPLGLLICDEAHRLKNALSQTYIAVAKLKTQARLLVTGTPIQNDLREYFSLFQLACQGLLGEAGQFRSYYEGPILRANDPDASESDQKLGKERMEELWALAGRFVLRRSQALLRRFLPPKTDLVVCVTLSPLQKELYPHAQRLAAKSEAVGAGGTTALAAIAWLKKLIAHPDLVRETLPADLAQRFPSDQRSGELRVDISGKMCVVDALLAATAPDKMVLVSNSTCTLSLLQKLCALRRIGCLRLDGATSAVARTKVVAKFNDTSDAGAKDRVLLLSSKAGGCGLNLIGANRLVLVDPDWNPANDEQALARVWRDGQQRPCFVYRLLATGTMEEKMFQRQALKKAVGACVVDKAGAQRNFSRKELRQLFTYAQDCGPSDTHSALKCRRCVGGVETRPPAPPPTAEDASDAAMDLQYWNHAAMSKNLPDQALRFAWKAGVTFVFYRVSQQKPTPVPTKVAEVENETDCSAESDIPLC